MKKTFAIGTLAVVLATSLVIAGGGQAQDAERLLKAAINTEMVDGNLNAAIEQYKKVAASGNRVLAAQALVRMADCYQRLGDAQSKKIYEQLLRDYSDQKDAVTIARARLGEGSRPDAAGASRTVLEGRALADPAGSISPDGRHFAFRDETGDLAVYARDTGRHQRLTTNPKGSKEGVEHSVFSPDGSQLAYSWGNELRVINRSGGRPRVLYANMNAQTTWLMPYDWSHDGRTILVLAADSDRNRRLMLISATDGSAQQLKSLDWLMGIPDRAEFSPDGRFIAYDRAAVADNKRGPADVYAIAVDGSSESPLLQAGGSDTFLGWFPDGKSVLVARERDGGGAWTIPFADGRASGAPRRIMDLDRVTSKGFSAGGDLYYYQQTGTPDIYLATLDPVTGRVTEAPAVLPNRLSAGRFNATWSPTGDRLLFTAGDVLGIYDTSTTGVGMFPLKMNYAPSPTWMPDGRAILTNGVDQIGRTGIFRIDLSTSEPEPLFLERQSGQARMTPDGETVIYRRLGQRAAGEPPEALVSRNLRTGFERELHRRDSVGGFFQLSQSGQFIVIRVGTPPGSRALQIIPTSGGAPRTILEEKDEQETRWMAGMAWSADGRHVFMGRGNDIWRVPVDGGSPQPLGVKMTGIQHISANPDGRRIAFVAGNGQVRDEIRVIANVVALRDRAR